MDITCLQLADYMNEITFLVVSRWQSWPSRGEPHPCTGHIFSFIRVQTDPNCGCILSGGVQRRMILFRASKMVDSRSSTVHAWVDEGVQREFGVFSQIFRKQCQHCVGMEILTLVPSGYRHLTIYKIKYSES